MMVATLEILPQVFTICKPAAPPQMGRPFHFLSVTDREVSLVCPAEEAPAGAAECAEGWRGLRVAGTLDFSLVGVLSRLSSVLAAEEIGIFVVSTYETDYLFTKAEDFDRALAALRQAGYQTAVLNVQKRGAK